MAERFLEKLNDLVWGPWLIVLFIGTGIFLTVRLRFLPWRNLGFALRQVIGDIFHPSGSGNGEISPFESLMTAMAAMMGTGNIVGVATAMVLGGPGALVWMVLSALIGMASGLTESVLTMHYRCKKTDNTVCGGPMYVLALGFRPKALGRVLAVLFCVFTLGASLGMGNMTQANSVSEALNDTFGIPAVLTGMLLLALSLLVLMGGISSIGKVCGILVPVMSIAYFAATAAVIIINFENIADGLTEMLQMAFSLRPLAGGLGGTIVAGMGNAMRFGISRGVFSNEAGLGSAPIAAACARTDDPVRQSYMTMSSIFFDTIVVCLATGLAIASSGLLGAVDASGAPLSGAALTSLVFEAALGPAGRILITAGIAMFAFATIIGWEYYGEVALEYLLCRGKIKSGPGRADRSLTGKTALKKAAPGRALLCYRLLYCVCAFTGAVVSLQTVWNFSDIMNAAMAIPNLICILTMSGQARAILLKNQK